MEVKKKFQVNTRAGYVDIKPTEVEMLLPMGYSIQSNGEIETPLERQKRLMKKQTKANPKQVDDDSEMLLPAGIELED